MLKEAVGKVVGRAGGALKVVGIAVLAAVGVGAVLVLGSKATGEDEVYVESDDVTPVDTDNTEEAEVTEEA